MKVPLSFGIFLAAMLMLNVAAAAADVCGVDVYGLDVQGNTVSAYVKNTGCCTKPVYYTLYVDGGVVDSGQFILASGSIKRFEKVYTFGYGRYEVRLTVSDSCYTDSDYIIHFVTQPDSRYDYDSCCTAGCQCYSQGCAAPCVTSQDGWHDNYRCSGSWVQRWFVSGGLGGWKDWEHCPNGCRNGKCLDACGVDIISFKYDDRVVLGERADIRVSVRNMADEDQIISLALYSGDERKAHYSVWVSGGNTLIKDLFFYPDETSVVRVEAGSTCGGFDSASATVRVVEKTTEDAYAQSEGTGGYEGIAETAVYMYPDSLDIELGSGKALAIDIRSSRTQDFAIDVAGVPAAWVSYKSRIGVTDKETAYVYVTPKDLGSHDMIVTVKALGENRVFKENIGVFVADRINVIRADSQGDFVTGLVSVATSAWFLLVVATIVLIIVILLGTGNLTYEEY